MEGDLVELDSHRPMHAGFGLVTALFGLMTGRGQLHYRVKKCPEKEVSLAWISFQEPGDPGAPLPEAWVVWPL